MYSISVEHLSSPNLKEIRWCLDRPIKGSSATYDTLAQTGLCFQGWVISRNAKDVIEPFVRCGSECFYFSRSVRRPDVVKRVLAASPDGHEQLRCGFRFGLPLNRPTATFGVRIGGREHALAIVSIIGSLKVLEGAGGWLFLDNDTNRSVEQFTGKYLLEAKELAAWRAYLDALSASALDVRAKHAVLLAPAKEMVLAEFHPFPKGKRTPVEQLFSIARAKHNLVYPAEELQHAPERTFRLGDTHWTPYGAMLAVVEVSKRLGISSEDIRRQFAKDVYTEREVVGDLGNKLYPPRAAKERLLRGFSYRRLKYYDNELPNFGRILALSNPAACVEGRCLIFGSSSSYSMLDYVGRVFSETVFVHSAGGVDLQLLHEERPDYLIAQTNGRFVVRAPVVGDDLVRIMSEKVATLDSMQRKGLLHKSEQWLAKTGRERPRFYHDLLMRAVACVSG